MNTHTGFSLAGSPISVASRDVTEIDSPTQHMITMLNKTTQIQGRARNMAMMQGDINRAIKIDENARQTISTAKALHRLSVNQEGTAALEAPIRSVSANAARFLPERLYQTRKVVLL